MDRALTLSRSTETGDVRPHSASPVLVFSRDDLFACPRPALCLVGKRGPISRLDERSIASVLERDGCGSAVLDVTYGFLVYETRCSNLSRKPSWS